MRAVLLMLTLSAAGDPTFAQVQQEQSSAVLSNPEMREAKRSALVIGNAAYQHVQALQNPEHDAGAMASKLKSLGYRVQYAHNMDRLGMNEAISTFLNGVEPGSDTLIYYSGHGVELNGANYLLPIDIPALSPDSDRLLRTEAINLTDLLLDVQERKARVTLVILDACRDNPFRVTTGAGQYRSLGSPSGGLAAINPPRGTFVLFAAGVGEQALDNLGGSDISPYGLFTRKLLSLMDEPGLEIRQLTYKLRAEVSQAAISTTDHHSQIPSYYDQMLGDFYFKPSEATLTETNPTNGKADKPTQVPSPEASGPSNLIDADAAPAMKRACIGAQTDVSFARLVNEKWADRYYECRRALLSLPNDGELAIATTNVREASDLGQALKNDSIISIDIYLSSYPTGQLRGIAERRKELLTRLQQGAPEFSSAKVDSGKVKPDPVDKRSLMIAGSNAAGLSDIEVRRLRSVTGYVACPYGREGRSWIAPAAVIGDGSRVITDTDPFIKQNESDKPRYSECVFKSSTEKPSVVSLNIGADGSGIAFSASAQSWNGSTLAAVRLRNPYKGERPLQLDTSNNSMNIDDTLITIQSHTETLGRQQHPYQPVAQECKVKYNISPGEGRYATDCDLFKGWNGIQIGRDVNGNLIVKGLTVSSREDGPMRYDFQRGHYSISQAVEGSALQDLGLSNFASVRAR